MNLKMLRNPFTSIYDNYEVLKVWNIVFGIAYFSRDKRFNGEIVHFYDKGDIIIPAVVSIISFTSITMIFFQRCYEMDTDVDDLFYKSGYFIITMGAIMSRLILVKKMKKYLNSHKLIEEVDDLLRQRKIDVNYEESRSMSKVVIVCTLCCVLVVYLNYSDRFVSEDVRIYHFIYVLLGIVISMGSILLECHYLAVFAMLIRKRMTLMASHLIRLKKTKNSKIIVQELHMMSIVHFKLCKSWGGAVEVLGPAVIVNHGVFYVYCFFPLTYFDYLVPRMKYEMAPMLAVLFFGMSVMLKVFSGAKREADKFKNTLVEFNLSRGLSEPDIIGMCKTLLLQIEHVNISLVFNGFFVVGTDALLSGIKTCSTYMMFIMQMNNSQIF